MSMSGERAAFLFVVHLHGVAAQLIDEDDGPGLDVNGGPSLPGMPLHGIVTQLHALNPELLQVDRCGASHAFGECPRLQ